jgi:hypothetical protein
MKINILDTYRFYLSQGMEGVAASNLTTATVLQDGEKDCECGSVTLANGDATLNITTACTPTAVWLWLDPPGVSGCGFSEQNLASATPLEQGFTLNADIKSDLCVVNWRACE